MLRHGGTCRERRRRPTHALQCPRWASSLEQSVPRTKVLSVAPQGVGSTNGLPTSVKFHHWTLGFRQSSFRPIVQALRGHRIPVFCGPPLSNHALVLWFVSYRGFLSPFGDMPLWHSLASC